MTQYNGPDHVITVTTEPYGSYDTDKAAWIPGVDYEIEHPVECDALKYGELCALDREFNENGSGIPSEPGVYVVSYWSHGPDYFGEYDAGVTVEKRGEQPVEVVAEAAADPWAVAP